MHRPRKLVERQREGQRLVFAGSSSSCSSSSSSSGSMLELCTAISNSLARGSSLHSVPLQKFAWSRSWWQRVESPQANLLAQLSDMTSTNHFVNMRREVEKLEAILNALSQGAVQSDGLQQLVTKFVESEVLTLREALSCSELTNGKFMQIDAKFKELEVQLKQFDVDVSTQFGLITTDLNTYPLKTIAQKMTAVEEEVGKLRGTPRSI